MTSFECKYELSRPFMSWRHVWTVVGARMAMHLHIDDMGEDHGLKYGDRYSGGIEIHYRVPPDYMRDQAPMAKCWLLGGPCWHDGSSLQATEHWIPMWLVDPHNHERIFGELQTELMDRDGGYTVES